MRRLLINSRQRELIRENENMQRCVNSLPSHLTDSLNQNQTPLSGVLPKEMLLKLLCDRVRELESCFSDNIQDVNDERISKKLSRLLSVCKRKESPLKEQLEKLCYNTIVSLFELPDDGIDYEYELVDTIDHNFHIKPDTRLNSGIDDEIAKRLIINTLVIGGAMVIYENAKQLYINELFDMDEDLPHLYSKIVKLNAYLMLRQPQDITDKDNKQMGYENVTLGNDESNVSVEVKGVNFPTLLTESLHAFLEIIASYGLPDEKGVVDKVLNICDTTENEPWYMMLGPSLWNSVIGRFGDLSSTDLPYVLRVIFQQSPDKFMNIINEFLNDGDNVDELVRKITEHATYIREYDDFENTLSRDDGKSIIKDSEN